MPSPKIVIVLSKNGMESVTVSAPDSVGRALGYELCKGIERELGIVNEAIKRQINDASANQEETH